MHQGDHQSETQHIEHMYLTFKVAEQYYAADINHIYEIISTRAIEDVPNKPSHIQGVITFRDQIMPTINLRAYFSEPVTELDISNCVVVLHHNGNMISVLVDKVDEVLEINPTKISNRDMNHHPVITGIGRVENIDYAIIGIATMVSETSDDIQARITELA